MANETKVSKEIREALKRFFPELRFWRNQCGLAKGIKGGIVRMGEPGTPDYVGYYPNRGFFGLEVKDPNGKTSPKREQMQNDRLADIIACGGIAIKASSAYEACSLLAKEVGREVDLSELLPAFKKDSFMNYHFGLFKRRRRNGKNRTD